MSGVGKTLDKAAGVAADNVKSTMTAFAQDLESGMASFFSAGDTNARTHQAKPQELSTEQEAGKPILGKVEAEHMVEGKRHYAISYDSGAGERGTTLVPAGKTQYNIGDDAIFKVGSDGSPGLVGQGKSAYEFGL
jgi:hypothetical protein